MKKTLLSSAAAVSVLTFGFTIEADAVSTKVTNVAHRGASGYAPENTIAAFDKAVEMRADYFELDVQMTKDGQLVIMHDNTVDRTTDGTGFIASKTWKEMQSLDAGSWFSPQFTGQHVPTFEEVLDRYKGNRIGILIELKSPELYPGIEQKVAQALKDRNMDKQRNNKIIIQSFNHQSVQKSKSLLPNIKHGVLLLGSSTQTDDASIQQFATYADYYNPSKSLINKDLVDRVHRAGMKVEPYTVRKADEVKPLIDAGVDGIITDFPDYVQVYTNGRNK